MRRPYTRASLAAMVLLGTAAAIAGPSPDAQNAVRLCHEAEMSPAASRADLWARGLASAEAALAARPDDPVAHFALFCNLGKRAAASEWAEAIRAVPRLRQHIDRALELEPHYVDALAAKGAFLARLPRMLGGDPAEGERLVRTAIARAPEDAGLYLVLAAVLHARGREEDAGVAVARWRSLTAMRPPDGVAGARVEAMLSGTSHARGPGDIATP